MRDVIVDLLIAVIYGVIVVLLIRRIMEARGINYSVARVSNGRIFEFRLGLYAGKLRLIKAPSCVRPFFSRHVYGWDIVFPPKYTEKEMDEFLLKNDLPDDGNPSHTVDLKVYREVVIRRNCDLSCVAGKICKIC